MHRTLRCFMSGRALILPLALCCVSGSANAQTATATVAVPAAKPASTTAPKVHRHHRHHHRQPSTDAASSLPTPGDYPGRLGVKVRLTDGKHVWTITRHQLGVAYAPGGGDTSAPGQFQFVVKQDVLHNYLTQLAAVIHRAPVDAHPVVADPQPDDPGDKPVAAKIVPAKPGQYLDIKETSALIRKSIEDDPANTKIRIVVVTKPARVDASQLAGIDARIGYFVTRFNPDDEGRTETVRRAIDMIDGAVLKPGDIFSVNGTVGERTAARGFGVGHVFVDGKMKKEVGGGMCQVATTLFNAAMLADLKIVERHQHVRTIPYVSPGRDATVWYGEKDFKFQNDTDEPVYISYKTTYSHAIVALYGKKVPGQTVKLVSHYKQLAERHFTGTFYRVVYSPDGKVTKDKPYYSDYEWTPALDYQR